MRPLAFFLATTVAAVAALVAFQWWMDPFGATWHPQVVAAARAAESSCAISDDLVGPDAWAAFKESLVTPQTRTIVFGTSRVLQLRSRPGESGFVNAGAPGEGPRSLRALVLRLHRRHPAPLTAYVGVELFWLNRSWAETLTFPHGRRLTSLAGRQTLEESLALVRDTPLSLFRRWKRYRARHGCVIARTSRVLEARDSAWRVDGSLVYAFQLLGRPNNIDDEFTRDLVRFEGPYYKNWTELDAKRLRRLDEALSLMSRYGWRVVGFTLPYSPRYVERLATALQTARQWRAFGRVVPMVFARHGFRYVDLRDVRDVPCPVDAFVDDGWHPNAACAFRVRERLERAARVSR